MKIAIVGVGEVGTYYAEKWHIAGHEIVLTYYRDEDKARAFASRLGPAVRVASPAEAVQQADLILFCPRFEHITDAARQVGDVGQRILIDANNPFNPERTGIAQLEPEQSAATLVAELFPQARLVKAFHNLGIQTILSNTDRKLAGFIAGDDAATVNTVSQLARDAHLDPVPTGTFSTSGLSEFPGPLFGQAFTKQEALVALQQLSNGGEPLEP